MREQTVVLAGRRIDAQDDQPPRFPLNNVEAVRARLKKVFKDRATLVCSAACGADLIALEEASSERMQCKVILPFSRQSFRDTSVVDRPGNWGPLFDRIIDDVEEKGDLLVLSSHPEEKDAYAKVNTEILRQGLPMTSSKAGEVLAVIVWEGSSRGPGDLTAAFLKQAGQEGYRILEVPTSGENRP